MTGSRGRLLAFAARTGVFLALATGCATSARETGIGWNDAEPVVLPLATSEREGRGRLVVKTQRQDVLARTNETAVRFRGYRLFREDGTLVRECRSLYEGEDVRWLDPGRYVVTGSV